jgi:hypothetical protein
MSDIPLFDEIDSSILMHRDAHFGGDFSTMIRYYEEKGKGAVQEFEVKRLYELAELELQMQQNLAALVLSGAEAEQVGLARQAYKELRDLYETKTKRNHYPVLIANLILSEEEDPIEEIKEILAEGGKIIPELLLLIRSDEYSNSLFPGYGQAPVLAARCLGLIGDKRAIIALFETIGHSSDFFDEDTSIQALKLIGQPAKEFLLHVVKGKPFNEDNERAAIALGSFKEDPEVSAACFELLKELDLKKNPVLATYLILACAGLENTPYRDEFIYLAHDHSFPKDLRQDIISVTRDWN